MKLIKTVLAVIMTLTAGCVTENNEPEGWSLPIGATMPAFEAKLNDGTTVTSASLIGHETVIVFFNTTCGDCRRELPQVNAISHEYPDVVFLCIARAETAEPIAEFWEQHELTLKYSPQPDREIYSLFANITIPRIFVFSADGRLTASLFTAESLRKELKK